MAEARESSALAGGSTRKSPDDHTSRVISSLEILQLYEPPLLQAIENHRREQAPLTIYVPGLDHDADIVVAGLRVAHAYGVTVTFVPRPGYELGDEESDAVAETGT